MRVLQCGSMLAGVSEDLPHVEVLGFDLVEWREGA
jgi:hypothetical protein